MICLLIFKAIYHLQFENTLIKTSARKAHVYESLKIFPLLSFLSWLFATFLFLFFLQNKLQPHNWWKSEFEFSSSCLSGHCCYYCSKIMQAIKMGGISILSRENCESLGSGKYSLFSISFYRYGKFVAYFYLDDYSLKEYRKCYCEYW